MTMAMTDVENAQRESWRKNLEDSLQQACAAEANKDYEAASTLFRWALDYEAKLRPDVTDTIAYVNTAGAVYAGNNKAQ